MRNKRELVSRRHVSAENITGLVTLLALIALTVTLLYGWLVNRGDAWYTAYAIAGGLFGISAYIFLASGGYETINESTRVREGQRRSLASYVGLTAIALLTIAFAANVVEAATEVSEAWWVMFRRALLAVLIVTAYAYVALRLLRLMKDRRGGEMPLGR